MLRNLLRNAAKNRLYFSQVSTYKCQTETTNFPIVRYLNFDILCTMNPNWPLYAFVGGPVLSLLLLSSTCIFCHTLPVSQSQMPRQCLSACRRTAWRTLPFRCARCIWWTAFCQGCTKRKRTSPSPRWISKCISHTSWVSGWQRVWASGLSCLLPVSWSASKNWPSALERLTAERTLTKRSLRLAWTTHEPPHAHMPIHV